MKWIIAYVSAGLSFGLLDFLWLGWASLVGFLGACGLLGIWLHSEWGVGERAVAAQADPVGIADRRHRA